MYQSDEIEFINHIYKEVQFIIEAKSKLTEYSFYEDEVYKRAITRSFEIIGEATKSLNLEFREKYKQIPWTYMAKLRDKIIHHYMGIDFEIIWNTMENEIPELALQIELILKEYK